MLRIRLEEFSPKGFWSPNRNLIISLYIYFIELKYFLIIATYWGQNPSSLFFFCFHLCNENLYATVNSNIWLKHSQDSTLNPVLHVQCVTPATKWSPNCVLSQLCVQPWFCRSQPWTLTLQLPQPLPSRTSHHGRLEIDKEQECPWWSRHGLEVSSANKAQPWFLRTL